MGKQGDPSFLVLAIQVLIPSMTYHAETAGKKAIVLQPQHWASRQVSQNQLLIKLFSLDYLVEFMQSGLI